MLLTFETETKQRVRSQVFNVFKQIKRTGSNTSPIAHTKQTRILIKRRNRNAYFRTKRSLTRAFCFLPVVMEDSCTCQRKRKFSFLVRFRLGPSILRQDKICTHEGIFFSLFSPKYTYDGTVLIYLRLIETRTIRTNISS